MNTRFALLTALLLSGCHGSTGGNGNGSGTELNANIGIDLSKVVGFVISRSGAQGTTSLSFPDDTSTDGGASQSQLYALGADDSLTIVTVTQIPDAGTSTMSQSAEPLAVLDTRAYVFLAYFNVTFQGLICRLIAARKSDGALYCITDGPDSTSWLGGWAQSYWKVLQSDASGELAWLDFPGWLMRFDLTDPNHPTSTRLFENQPFAGAQAVDAEGDALISNGDQFSGGPGDFTRVELAGGGFFDVSAKGSNCIAVAPESGSNDFYYNKHVGPYTQNNQWVRLSKGGAGAFTETALFDMTSTSCQFGMVRTRSHFFLTGPLIPQMGGGTSDVSNYTFVDVTNQQATLLTVDTFKQITRIAGYESAIFLLGTDATGSGGIVKYDIASGKFATLLAPGTYNVTTMDVSPGGDVTFYGQRASDGAMILGNIPAGSTTPIILATGFPLVTQIQRIN